LLSLTGEKDHDETYRFCLLCLDQERGLLKALNPQAKYSVQLTRDDHQLYQMKMG